MSIRETNEHDLMLLVNSLLSPYENVLDIGSGVGVFLDSYAAKRIVALEIHRPFLENPYYKSDRVIPINADAQDVDRLFLPRSFHVVTMIDVIEHFNKQAALILLNKAERIASQRVIIFTPRGFFPQHLDHYNMDGAKYQTHYSGWEPEEFAERGYEVLILKQFHDQNNPAFVQSFGSNHPPVDALLAWKNI